MPYHGRSLRASLWLLLTFILFAEVSLQKATPNLGRRQGPSNRLQRRIATAQDSGAKDPQTACPGYKSSNVQKTNVGMTALLSLAGDACNVYGTDIAQLRLVVENQAADRLSVSIFPVNLSNDNRTWFQLGGEVVPLPGTDSGSGSSDLDFSYGDDPSFWFKVTRKSTQDVLFSTQGQKIVFEDQFLELKVPLSPQYNLYGLGEVIHGFRLSNNLIRTMWATDAPDGIDGTVYGSHPVYLETRYYENNSSGQTPVQVGQNFTGDRTKAYVARTHGVYLRNSHGQEILLKDDGITWRTIGGSFDMYFFAGPDAKEVIRSYQKSATGLPAMQSYWTLGFHQCRWGYKSWDNLQSVVDGYENANIPLEAIWSDIDYMDRRRDFTSDPTNFPVAAGQTFLNKLHQSNRRWVPIVDAAIYIPNPNKSDDAYDVFDKGNSVSAFAKKSDGSLYIGLVWPGYTVFPDLYAGLTTRWWTESISNWWKQLSFDGIWLDMNEPSSFCYGSCGSGKLSQNPMHPPFAMPGEPGFPLYEYPEGFASTNATEAAAAANAGASAAPDGSGPGPSYTTTVKPGTRNILEPPYAMNLQVGSIGEKTLAPDTKFADGSFAYDSHNIWGHTLVKSTYDGLSNLFSGKRPFILSRSTFSGTGQWAAHWGGDNQSKWYYLYFSIPQALSFSIFGIPMFGVDTCGFIGNTDNELCSRWMQLSAFFPFYRNHNTLAANSQEAYIWSSVAQASRDAMTIRYSLLPYIYTLMSNAHAYGDTVMRALAWEFPSEPALASADRQFMLGPALLITPVLHQGATSVSGVFPGVGNGEVWYDWYTQTAVTVGAGENKTIDAPLGHIPVYIRGGYVLPLQGPALTTTLARQQPYGLIVALNKAGAANGTLYIDDGESVSMTNNRTVTFTATSSKISAKVTGNFKVNNPLANITVLGLAAAPPSVKFGGTTIKTTNYDANTKILTITGLADATKNGAYSGNWDLSLTGAGSMLKPSNVLYAYVLVAAFYLLSTL